MVEKILGFIAEKLGFKVPAFLANINKDTLTSYLGLIDAVVVALMTELATGSDPTNPITWLGYAKAVKEAWAGWATNKVPAVAPAPRS